MRFQDSAIENLQQSGVLAGIGWAWRSACRQVLDDYTEESGYSTAALGTMRYSAFCDRSDRVFSCGKYEVVNPNAGIDVLHAGLLEEEILSMPIISPALIKRADLSGSPGWSCDNYRWLLQSFPHGSVDDIHWAGLSQTKRRVAGQINPDYPTLFDEELPVPNGTDGIVLIVAHKLNYDTAAAELFIGLPQTNNRDESAWYWRHPIRTEIFKGEDRKPNRVPVANPNDIGDAPVRLRSSIHQASMQGEAL